MYKKKNYSYLKSTNKMDKSSTETVIKKIKHPNPSNITRTVVPY